MKFKLRKGMRIGGLAAETDELLDTTFVDLGYISAIADTDNPAFLILGRAGSGKTALLERLRKNREHVSSLDPDELSMQYLHSSSVLRTIASWGVNLEIFYKYLWRHVCILELIRLKYGDVDDVPSRLQQIFDFAQIWKKDEKKTKELSQQYLREYGSDYWVKTDTRIKALTTEIETKLSSDPKLAATFGFGTSNVQASLGRGKEERLLTRVEHEVIEHAQQIVSDFQIAALNRVVELLEKYGFSDEQRQYYLVIDNLDKNWMPDDVLYLELLKSLLFTVYELNRKLHSVKIVVALRDNIYHRIFERSEKHEPQREKWRDVQIKLVWSKEKLIELVNKRLAAIFRKEYTLGAPTIVDILPERKRRSQENAIDYILQRTFMRPREIIDFVNTCIDQSDSFVTLSWSNLTRAEAEYSERRLQSAFDEWKDGYFGLPATDSMIRKIGPRFTLTDFVDDLLYEILADARNESCTWLGKIHYCTLEQTNASRQSKIEILKALFLTGIIGVKLPDNPHILYSFEQSFSFAHEVVDRCEFIVHKMFWSAFNLASERATNTSS